jgi:hypothetical protein
LMENDYALFANDAEKAAVVATCKKVIEWM